MGRQKGEGARSKSRPSSSSLAASLLPAGAATIGFGGYVGNSRLDSTLPIENVSVSPKLDVDGEVAQHLKRLGRKDPTTKLKALASLSEIFKEKSKEDIIQIIPQWAFEYKRLLQDYNREVRRAAHDTMTNLVITAGRGLAPFLKTLMGPWWVSQFDPVSEVSQAARKSLQDAFPVQERRLDALILCTNEVLLYIEENLKLTPQSMSDKATPQDELEEMHQRIISTSLLALATLIDILFGMQIQKLDFENVTSEPKNASKARETVVSSAEKIFSAHTYFLEFLKSQAPAVRSASYSVLGSFIKHIPDAFNEGNKKALSTAILGAFQEKDPTCHPSMWDTTLLFSRRFPDCWSISNIQKTALSRFWVFLRKGCYGSQQVSYPQLVLFLDTIPAKTIDGERFFLNFFQNLWEGRNPSHSSAADRLSFFKALEECFVWGIHNASRYLTGTDPISSFQVNLISSILVNLLWRDYLLVVSPKLQDEALSGKSRGSLEEDMLSFEGRKLERLNTKYPLSYMQDLGKCIVEVLSDLSLMEHELLNTFCTVFQEECLSIIQQAEHLERPFDHVEQIVNFLLLLKQHAMQKGETWPLEFLALPLVTKAFPLIKSLDSPDAVKLLAVTISIFGPRKVVPQLSMCTEGHSINHLSKKDDDTSTSELFLQVFREIFVPWCLHGCNLSTGARLDLLLALLDDELFPEQWCSIITYATRLDEHHSFEVGSSGSDHFFVLAMLMEKVREEIDNRKIQAAVNHRQGSIPEHWHHKLLDSAAVSVARCNPPFLKSYSRFLRAILGGLTEDDRTFLVTKDSMILVFEELLKKFLPLLNDSPFHWTKYASSLLLCTASQDLVLVCESKADILELAKFSLEVLEGSFFCLRRFDQESELVPCISATIIIIDWEYRMASQVITEKGGVVSSNIIDGKLVENAKAFIESVHALRLKINSLLTKGLSIQNLRKLENILVQSIRSAIFETGIVNTDIIPSMCCQWMVEVLEFVGCDQNEEQSLLDQLLDEGKFWPFWIVSPLNDKTRSATPRIGIMSAEIQAPEHCQFVAFVNELISKLGFSRVIAGSLLESTIPSSSVETLDGMGSLRSYRRPWLAAEILCTWRWKGGCALGSFLPFLSEFAKRGTSSSEESLLDAIIDLLLNGALVCGARDEVCFFNVWPATDDEIESIQDPFLRGLISLLSTLLMKNNIWGRKKAAVLFDRLVGTLFIGTMVNRDCLKILPYVINVIIRPIRQASDVPDNTSRQNSLDSFDENQMIVDWLQRAVSLPPLTSWKPGQDFEEWVQVIISCYPLDAIGGISALNAASGTKINHTEKMLLLDLFRKQRADVDALAPVNQSPSVQMILSKLTAISVGYCWKEFNEDDWEFVLSQVRRSTDSAVMLMEEITENVDEIIVNKHPSDNLEDITRKLEQVVQIAEGSLVNIASDALFTFSMFCGIIENQKEEGPEVLEIVRMDKWGNVKDRILEGVLRLFFATGVAEAVAGSVYKDASAIVASSRLVHSRFWQLVASIVINSPENVRNTAVQSVGLWELSKGPISSLYAILFSSLPLSSLQLAAFVILSTEPVSHLSFIKEDTACLIEDNIANQEFDQSHPLDSSSEESVHFREEISCMIEKSPSEIIEMDLVAHERVNVFIAWALLLSNLHSLPPASPTKQRMIQCVQDSANSKILDCLFQHIPLKAATHSLKKKDRGLPVEVSQVATAAKCSISTGSLMFSVESLWPVGIEKMASLAGAIYGLMLHALPAYVRDWFTSIRDRSTSIAIESFTKTWCSPPLLADELSQIKKASVADENFSISVSKSVYEVVATYKKEETGMDLVITFPVSYPLRPVDVDCTRSLGISDLKQRKWLMSMLAFVRSQNGALAEAIRTWKSNFDKEFLGVEECPICYSIIHTSNNSLPRLACKTCKHKFHKACLFKWFHTSHKSTCPLCQSPF